MTANAVVELDGLSRDDWLAARRQGIGSSDVAGVCGLDRFSSPLSIWLDKRGEADEADETDVMRMGRLLEEVVAQEFEHQTGLRTQKPPAMYQSAAHPFMLASPDRFVGERGYAKVIGLLECKTSRVDDLWEAGPPSGVVLQATHQMIVCEQELAYVGVLLHGREFHHWPVELDPAVAEALIEIEREFWQLVESGEPPAADGHAATTAALAKLYEDVEVGETVDLTDLGDELRELARVRIQVKDARDRQAELENIVKRRLGTAEIGLYEGAEYVTWKAGSAFDEEAFASAEPDLYAFYRKTGVDLERLKKERADLDKRFRVPHAGPRRFNFKGGTA